MQRLWRFLYKNASQKFHVIPNLFRNLCSKSIRDAETSSA